MPVLFTVSILAFVALLWATISIVGFVRRARRRQRKRAADAAETRQAPSGCAEPEPIRFGNPVASARTVHADFPGERDSAEESVGETLAAKNIAPEFVIPPLAAAPPPRLRSFPTRLGKHPVNPLAPDEQRPGWNPFPKDFPDVTDPTPSRRYGAPRGRNKDTP